MLLFGTIGGAHAYRVPHADLVCESAKNIAVARFAEADEEDVPKYALLPQKLDDGLSAKTGTGRRDCALSNGWHIRLRNGEGQAYAYGAGGAAPGAFFSLWIEGRKIISRRIWTNYNYAQELDAVAAVIVSPAGLTICELRNRDVRDRPADEIPPWGKQSCKTTRLEIEKLPIDEIEYRGKVITATRKPATELTVAGVDTAPCENLIRYKQNGDDLSFFPSDAAEVEPDLSDDKAEGQMINSHRFGEENEHFWQDMGDAQTLFGFKQPLRFEVARSYVNSNNLAGVAVRREGDGHYFDGSFIVVAPKGTPIIEIFRVLYGDGSDADEEKAIENAKAKGWRVYAGGEPGFPDGSPRYVSVERFDYLGAYLYARPNNVDSSPTAHVVKLAEDGTPSLACTIQRPLLNY